jgi:dTDP-4-dehydrorhamnose reductase
MIRILATGANGQLGNEIRVLSSGFPEAEFYFTDYDSLDVTDTLVVREWMESVRPDFVIHCAAYTGVDKAEQDKEACFRLNALAPGIVAAACKDFSARMIHISTDYVFDGTASVPYTEDHPTNPQSIYGLSKRDGELACMKNPETVIVRTSWLYSSFGQNFVKTMIRLGHEKEHLNVVRDQVGTPTYARDLASVILSIISQSSVDPGKWKAGIYHYSNEGVCNWFDFALAIHELAGINCSIHPIETKDFVTLAKRPVYSVLNKSRIKSTYNLTIPHWLESLKKCMDIIKSS